MRPINLIVIHCSASPPAAAAGLTAAHIDRMHRERGFARIGYHYFIRVDGRVEQGRQEADIGAHVSGFNSSSIGVCYAGGLGSDNKPSDTRTAAQRQALVNLVRELKGRYPNARICGHRDLSPDTNKNGKVDQSEWLKACPSFDVPAWARAEGL